MIKEALLCLSGVRPSSGGGVVSYMQKWGILIETTNRAND
jgi:hypothetical protein